MAPRTFAQQTAKRVLTAIRMFADGKVAVVASVSPVDKATFLWDDQPQEMIVVGTAATAQFDTNPGSHSYSFTVEAGGAWTATIVGVNANVSRQGNNNDVLHGHTTV